MKQFLGLTLVVALGGCGFAGDPGTGEKIGQVIKLSQQGILVTTWEAQLIRGGINGGSGSFGVTPFDFTVPAELAGDVQRYVEAQTEVVIRYHRNFVYSLFGSDSSGYYLDAIRSAH